MIELYFFVKTVHILSSTILIGTGLGIAFFMFCSYFTDDLQQKLYAARTTVLADYVFTLPAVIVQPLTGLWLVRHSGYDWASTWLLATYVIYVIAGLCWLPVVWIQIQMKNMVMHSVASGTTLPARYNQLFKIWFLLGWPAFIGLAAIFFLMVIKPT
jgi:uncharacterized membrane protein